MKSHGAGDDWTTANAQANTIRAWYAERYMAIEIVVERIPSTRGTMEDDEVWRARIITPIAFAPTTFRKAVS